MGELVGAAELAGMRLKLEQEPRQPVAHWVCSAAGWVDESGLESVSQRKPAVLVDHMCGMDRQRLARSQAKGERDDERLADRGERCRVVELGLGVGDPELERAVLGTKPQVPPQVARVGKQSPADTPGDEPGELAPGREATATYDQSGARHRFAG